MRIELGNRPQELKAAMAALEEFANEARLDQDAAQAAELALDELLTNIISYGGLDSDQGKILVELCVEGNDLKIVVTDNGVAFNPFEKELPDQGGSIEERKMGGVGIHLVRQFMDECSYQRVAGCNVVTLLKSRAQG